MPNKKVYVKGHTRRIKGKPPTWVKPHIRNREAKTKLRRYEIEIPEWAGTIYVEDDEDTSERYEKQYIRMYSIINPISPSIEYTHDYIYNRLLETSLRSLEKNISNSEIREDFKYWKEDK